LALVVLSQYRSAKILLTEASCNIQLDGFSSR
jgi:hypothetical protein